MWNFTWVDSWGVQFTIIQYQLEQLPETMMTQHSDAHTGHWGWVTNVCVRELLPFGTKPLLEPMHVLSAYYREIWIKNIRTIQQFYQTYGAREIMRCIQRHVCDIFNIISIVDNMNTLMMAYDCRGRHDSYWRNTDRVQTIICAQQGIFVTQ